VTAAPPLAVADRFALTIDGLCRGIAAARIGGVMAPVLILLWNSLHRRATRFATLVARVQAGTLPRSRPRPRTRTGHCEEPGSHLTSSNGDPRSDEAISVHTSTPRQPPSRRPRLPRTFGWLIRLIPAVAAFRSQLQHLLSDPEIAELLTAAPQLGRILRPLCHMLGIGPSPDVPRALMLSSPLRPLSRQRQLANTKTPANTPPAKTEPPHPPPDPWQPLLLPPHKLA